MDWTCYECRPAFAQMTPQVAGSDTVWLLFVGLREGCCVCTPIDIDDLKWRITEAAAAVTCHMLGRVWEELDYRFDICRVEVGLTSSACKVWK
jgi:hypothetical protein